MKQRYKLYQHLLFQTKYSQYLFANVLKVSRWMEMCAMSVQVENTHFSKVALNAISVLIMLPV